MRRLFLDTSIFLLAAGGDNALRDPCRDVVALAAADSVTFHGSVEVVQEFAFHRMRKSSRMAAIAETRSLMGCLTTYPCANSTARLMLELIEATTIRGRDAVHAATALEQGFTEIVSVDPDFDEVPGLKRIDPREIRDT